jgi:hypothetical protein
VFAASKDRNAANNMYTTRYSRTTQVNSTNTSDLILFIIIADLIQNGTDLEYIECMDDNASKIERNVEYMVS